MTTSAGVHTPIVEVDIGETAVRTLSAASGTARVLACFRRAIYVQVPPGGLIVLTDGSGPRGPLHVRAGALPWLERETAVDVHNGAIAVARSWLRARGGGWRGAWPSRDELSAAVRPAVAVLAGWPVPEPLDRPGVAGRVDAAVRGHDLTTLAGLIGGRGPGLTPSGDDVLAGVLLVAAWSGGTGVRDVPALARTNEISRSYLECAMQGQCIEPAHDLARALSTGDPVAIALSRSKLGQYGASSGDALGYGIVLALSSAPVTTAGH